MSSVKITDNTPLIKSNTKQRASLFLRHMAKEMIKISTPNTPKDTGRMRLDVIIRVFYVYHCTVVWGKNYSVFQEKKQYQNYTTPGTGPHFAENAAKKLHGLTDKIAKQTGFI